MSSRQSASIYQLFPYQYSFYNMLVGVPGADGRYYIDVWRSALREALREMEEIPDTNEVIRIYTCGSSLNFVAHPRFRQVEKLEDADYIVALRRNSKGLFCDPQSLQVQDLPVIGEVSVNGVYIRARLQVFWTERKACTRQTEMLALRGRRLVPVERAVHLLTDAPARLFGLRDRGRIAVGAFADLTIVDPERVDAGPPRVVTDLPGRSGRLVSSPIGVAHVWVNGVEIVSGGDVTGATPGTVLRAGRDTDTVATA